MSDEMVNEYGEPLSEEEIRKRNIEKAQKIYNERADALWDRLKYATGSNDPIESEEARTLYGQLRNAQLFDAENLVVKAEKNKMRKDAYAQYASGEIDKKTAESRGVVFN